MCVSKTFHKAFLCVCSLALVPSDIQYNTIGLKLGLITLEEKKKSRGAKSCVTGFVLSLVNISCITEIKLILILSSLSARRYIF